MSGESWIYTRRVQIAVPSEDVCDFSEFYALKSCMLRSIAMSVSEEEFGSGVDDGISVQPVYMVEIWQIARLPEAIGAKGADAHARNTA